MLNKELLQSLVREKVNSFKKEMSLYFLDEWIELAEPVNGFGDKRILGVFVKRWGVGVVIQGCGVKLLEKFILEEITQKQVVDFHLAEKMIDHYLLTLKKVLVGGEDAQAH